MQGIKLDCKGFRTHVALPLGKKAAVREELAVPAVTLLCATAPSVRGMPW